METERQRFNRLHRSQCVIKNLGFIDNTAAFVFPASSCSSSSNLS